MNRDSQRLIVIFGSSLPLPGGIGTLSEFALAWSLLQVGAIPPRPLILIGAMWQEALESFFQTRYIFPEHVALLHLLDSPADAVAILEKYQ